MNRDLTFALAFALAALGAGCTLGPDFTPPADPAPAAWKAGAAAETPPLPQQWWTLFDDSQLSQLVESALAHNQDLQAGLARVEQARALAGLAAAAQLPSVFIDPSVERERFSANRATSPGTSAQSYTATSYTLPLDVSYEVDLWGRLRRQREAADAAAQATAYDQDALTLAISSEVARTWFAYRTAQREEAVLHSGAELRRRALEIVDGRVRAGIGNDFDTSRAQTELSRVQAEEHGVARARAALGNALAVLCGQAPADFATPDDGAAARAAETEDELGPLPDVPPGLPSELLRRRPDVAAAVERLHEACARIGMAETDAYPELSLTGAAGFVSTELNELFDASSKAWLLAADMSAPIYEGGAIDEHIRAARAFYDERAAQYRATLLVAFREVEDALSALSQLGAEIALQSQARASAHETYELTESRYRQGLIDYLDVVDAARAELDARRTVVQLERVRAESTVLLIEALGGGWNGPEPLAAQ